MSARPEVETGDNPHERVVDVSGIEVPEDKKAKPKQADILIELAQAADLFHTPDGIAYADMEVQEHRETWPIRKKPFRRWLARGFYDRTESAPNSEALQSALNVIEAQAHFDGPCREVHVRVAEHEGAYYLDLADTEWRAVEVTRNGWKLVATPPVRFRRADGMQALPIPQRGGDVHALHDLLNVADVRDFILVIAWLLVALRPGSSYPVLVLSGEQGSAKSTASRLLRSLVDPSTAPLRALPREDRDLFIAATNAHLLTFDNVSGLPSWISDTLCRLATGGGFATRQLYSDSDEVIFNSTRPVILNGIEDVVNRPDLADRALFLQLQPIPEAKRRPETDLWRSFEKARSRILGALLDAISAGLRRLPETRLDGLPRMADFALWATACEAGLWPAGTFIEAYTDNRAEAVDTVIESDAVASAVRQYMETRETWTGTARDLLGALAELVGEKASRLKSWPATPRALSGRLRRAATFLRQVGIEVDLTRTGQARQIRISRLSDRVRNSPSQPSQPSQTAENKAFRGDGRGDGSDAKDGWGDGTPEPTVTAKPSNGAACDGSDANDAKSATHSKRPPSCPRCDDEGCRWCSETEAAE